MSIHTSRTILASIALSIVFLFIISTALRLIGLSGEIGTTVTARTAEIGLWQTVETEEIGLWGTVETNQSPVGRGEGRGAGCGGHLHAPLSPLEAAIWQVETGRREGDIIGVMRAYWDRWCPEGTDEQRARVWNGGPRGASKKDTKKYWQKVSASLDKG